MDKWLLDLNLNVETNDLTNNEGTITVSIDELGFTKSLDVTVVNYEINEKINVDPANEIKLWWPAGYGDQKLYTITVKLEMNGESLNKTKQIGFRSVELVEEPVSDIVENGLSFYFKINNVDIFLLGSNWIPADSFQELIDEKRLMYLLESATKANMNVLRIWGGGLYEQDTFYELTDKLGILIWHDFMFACSVRFV